jgi:CRP/FNR family cyclic AMP-dependent transcriptional regulator
MINPLFLRSVLLFEDLADNDLLTVSNTISEKKYLKNNLIIFEEDEGHTLFIIRRGRVKISRINPVGEEVILAILGPTDFFGEVAVVDLGPRSATVTSLDEVELLCIRRKEFLELMHHYPSIAISLLKLMANRLRKTDMQIVSLSTLDARGRVINTIRSLARDLGRSEGDSRIIHELPLQRDLANMAGTSRETMSRLLARLEEEGWLRKVSGDLVIPDYKAFEKEFGS